MHIPIQSAGVQRHSSEVQRDHCVHGVGPELGISAINQNPGGLDFWGCGTLCGIAYAACLAGCTGAGPFAAPCAAACTGLYRACSDGCGFRSLVTGTLMT